VMEITLFGHVEVVVDGIPITGLSRKQCQVLAILALEPGVPVSKERLADLLWEGDPPTSYVGTLDSYVCTLRRRLGLRAGRTSVLATTQAGFVLQEDVVVDLSRFWACVRLPAEATNAEVVAHAERALAIADLELLVDAPYAEWAARARDVVSTALVELCAHGAQRANALGETQRAVHLATAAVRRDPVCEDAWRQLMLAHWFSGRRARALAAYGELRQVLCDELGDEPGQESQQLYLAILGDSAEPVTQRVEDPFTDLRAILQLLRQTLESTPGVRVPARDAALSEVAARALTMAAAG
jgi:DNA-binding SARP family transcriptional activator